MRGAWLRLGWRWLSESYGLRHQPVAHCRYRFHRSSAFPVWTLRQLAMSFYPALGINVLSLDTDIVISTDPYPWLKGTFAGHNLLYQRECLEWPCLNLGIVYMQVSKMC